MTQFLKILIILTALISVSLASPQKTKIADKQGRTIEVILLSHNVTHVECIKGSKNRTVSIPFTTLNAGSVRLIKKRLSHPIHLQAEVVISKRLRKIRPKKSGHLLSETSESGIRMNISADITVSRKSSSGSKQECSCYIIFLAKKHTQHNEPDKHYSLLNESFKFTPSFIESKHTTKKVRTASTNNYGTDFGNTYLGYIFFITNTKGDILHKETTVPNLKGSLTPEFLKSISKSKIGTTVNPPNRNRSIYDMRGPSNNLRH